MRFVFFDIECANCFQGKGKICSFGYVITNENFEIQEQHDMIVNPDSKFNLGPDIKLAYSKSEFKSAPLFPLFYDEIDALLSDPESLVFGFSASNDARYVRDECIRYNLPSINYRFYDVQKMYMCYNELKNQPSLVGLCNQYNIPENQDVHKSDVDARMTMEVLQNLCELTGKDVCDLISSYPGSVGEMKDGTLSWVFNPPKEEKTSKDNHTDSKNSGNKMTRFSLRYKLFQKYVATLNSLSSSDSNASLYGKTVCISAVYEEKHFNQMIFIAEKISSLGGKYTSVASNSDIFVKYDAIKSDGSQKKCPRYNKVMKEIANGKDITVISFLDFVNMLGISFEELVNCKKYKIDNSKIKPVEN